MNDEQRCICFGLNKSEKKWRFSGLANDHWTLQRTNGGHCKVLTVIIGIFTQYPVTATIGFYVPAPHLLLLSIRMSQVVILGATNSLADWTSALV
jgi:hypothetical protein